MTGSQEHIASAKEQPENLGHGCVLLGLRQLFGLQCVDFNVIPDTNLPVGERAQDQQRALSTRWTLSGCPELRVIIMRGAERGQAMVSCQSL
jgi:hypothetical protein